MLRLYSAQGSATNVIPSLTRNLGNKVAIPLTGLDAFASDIETCKHVSASLDSVEFFCSTLSSWRGEAPNDEGSL